MVVQRVSVIKDKIFYGLEYGEVYPCLALGLSVRTWCLPLRGHGACPYEDMVLALTRTWRLPLRGHGAYPSKDMVLAPVGSRCLSS
ncbi:hypothetical protein PilKf_00882 [Pillotina sp. SPG140]